MRASGKKRFRLPVAALTASLLIALALQAGVPDQPEDELKAAVVLSFLRYTEWPPAAPESTPINVGVMGRPDFVSALRRLLDGKAEGKRPFRLVELKTAAEGRGCQLVYLAFSSFGELRPALATLRDTPVLTMGESDRFLELGGQINLFLADGRVAFEFRKSVLDGAGYTISSKLLRFGQLRGRLKGTN